MSHVWTHESELLGRLDVTSSVTSTGSTHITFEIEADGTARFRMRLDSAVDLARAILARAGVVETVGTYGPGHDQPTYEPAPGYSDGEVAWLHNCSFAEEFDSDAPPTADTRCSSCGDPEGWRQLYVKVEPVETPEQSTAIVDANLTRMGLGGAR